MDPQLALSAIAIGGAAAYLAYRGWRTWRGLKTGCSGGCGCAKTTPANEAKEPILIPSDQLVLRRRVEG